MSRLLTIDNCMDCKHMKLISNMNIKTDIYDDIYYCIYNSDKPITLFKFGECEKRTNNDFKIPNDKCKLPLKE